MSIVKCGFTYNIDCLDEDGHVLWQERDLKNIIPLVGRQHIITSGILTSTWYLGLYSGNYAPIDGNTLASLIAAATEFTDYSQSQRVEYEPYALGSGSTLTNTQGDPEDAQLAVYDITAPATLYGSFMCSQPTKGNTTGVLLSAVKFSTARAVVSGNRLRVSAGLVLVSA